MKQLYFALALVAGFSIASASPAATRNYDCSKAGNANKAVCKTAVKGVSKAIAKSAPKAASKPKAAATKVSSTTTTKTTTERSYDCTKAGNKNKAVCKGAAVTANKPIAKETTTSTATRHYDCSKPGNASKTVCKASAAQRQTTVVKRAPPMAPVARATPGRTAGRPAAVPENTIRAGASAVCKDGYFSHSKVHTGACSHHGGVTKWF